MLEGTSEESSDSEVRIRVCLYSSLKTKADPEEREREDKEENGEEGGKDERKGGKRRKQECWGLLDVQEVLQRGRDLDSISVDVLQTTPSSSSLPSTSIPDKEVHVHAQTQKVGVLKVDLRAFMCLEDILTESEPAG